MRAGFPAALVQIHYHDRLGGVRQVMSDYSSVFRQIAATAAPNYWWCRNEGPGRQGDATVIDLPGADYHSFSSSVTFNRAVDHLTGLLLRRLDAVSRTSAPVAVIGHNLALGKNPALSEAFSRCARLLSDETDRYWFFSVLHDYAEQGRVDLLRKHALLRDCGIDVEGSLYAKSAPVHFIAPDRWGRKITGLSPNHLSVLPNRVVRQCTPQREVSDTRVRRLLQRCAKLDGRTFDTNLPLYCYPSRMIYRKNVLEALLLTTVLSRGALVTGPSGTSSADRRRMAVVQELAGKYRLSLAVDIGRIGPHSWEKKQTENMNPFSMLLPFARQAISTSLTEGFGYALYEPWLYGTPVIGRYPHGVVQPDLLKEMTLYRRLPVPASWVDPDRSYRRYQAALSALNPKNVLSKQAFFTVLIKKGTVDFGHLATATQAAIIRKVIRSEGHRDELLLLCRRAGVPLPGTGGTTRTGVRTTATVISAWSGKEYRSSFVKILSRRPVVPRNHEWFRHVGSRVRQSGGWFNITPAAGMD